MGGLLVRLVVGVKVKQRLGVFEAKTSQLVGFVAVRGVL